MKFHREGYKIVTYFFTGLVLLNVLNVLFIKNSWILSSLIFASVVFFFFIAWFFRVPQRIIDNDENAILAPADGKIVAIEEVFEKEYFKENRLQISIFMSPLNVHQNLSPVKGEVVYRKHKSGHFYPAFVPKSSEENERCSTVFKMNKGTEILTRQIAGSVARRIANYSAVGKKYKQGEEFGFIRFGSRVDVFLPTNVKVAVTLDEKSTGGKTILATFE